MLLCQAVFIDLIMCGLEFQHRSEDLVIQRHTLSKVHPIWSLKASVSLDGGLMELSKTFIGNQFRAGERVKV